MRRGERGRAMRSGLRKQSCTMIQHDTDNCGTKYGHNADCPQYCGQMRTNADNCGRVADKREHAGMKIFLTWK
eukprot:scaffold16282_cov40-Cyclotella_meneghiniana.AAC.1